MPGIGKYTPKPRGTGPEFLARWEDRSGFWRLVILNRSWEPEDSVYTDVAVTEPRPGDQWLARLNFVPCDGGWVLDEGGWWVRAVAPAISGS